MKQIKITILITKDILAAYDVGQSSFISMDGNQNMIYAGKREIEEFLANIRDNYNLDDFDDDPDTPFAFHIVTFGAKIEDIYYLFTKLRHAEVVDIIELEQVMPAICYFREMSLSDGQISVKFLSSGAVIEEKAGVVQTRQAVFSQDAVELVPADYDFLFAPKAIKIVSKSAKAGSRELEELQLKLEQLTSEVTRLKISNAKLEEEKAALEAELYPAESTGRKAYIIQWPVRIDKPESTVPKHPSRIMVRLDVTDGDWVEKGDVLFTVYGVPDSIDMITDDYCLEEIKETAGTEDSGKDDYFRYVPEEVVKRNAYLKRLDVELYTTVRVKAEVNGYVSFGKEIKEKPFCGHKFRVMMNLFDPDKKYFDRHYGTGNLNMWARPASPGAYAKDTFISLQGFNMVTAKRTIICTITPKGKE